MSCETDLLNVIQTMAKEKKQLTGSIKKLETQIEEMEKRNNELSTTLSRVVAENSELCRFASRPEETTHERTEVTK